MKPFKPEHYFAAALERMAQARLLYQQGKCYALAMYVAGVAVECMLRAFKGKRTKTVDERHDLGRLFQTSGMRHWERGPEEFRSFMAAVNVICSLWSNDCRYASEERVLAHLKKDPALRSGLKGDILKANARRLIECCQQVIDEGNKQWQSSTRRGSF